MIPRYSRPEMTALWTDQTRFEIWLEIEILALEAMVQLGTAPESALKNVREKAKFSTDRVLEIEQKVKHDVIAFLTNVAENVGEDARFLHLGLTSSDVLDTTFAVLLVRATEKLLTGLDQLLETVKEQALKYKNTVCVGRSHGIHAEPTTFGLKLANWYAELNRQKKRLQIAREDIAVGAISGAVGTFAHLNPAIEKHVCQALRLKPDPVSTQVISRDRHAALFLAYAQLAGTLERVCVEIRHLQRTEVREAEENFTVGQKGSSAMPHKRNPILTENICGLSRLIRSMATGSLENIPLWHERDISHSSFERVVAPDITIALDFALTRVTSVVKNLKVYPQNMKRNLDLTQGLIYSGSLLVTLAAKGLAREDAYALIQAHALATWDAINAGQEIKPEETFPARIQADKKIREYLTEKELTEALSLAPHLAQVEFVFGRVFEGEMK